MSKRTAKKKKATTKPKKSSINKNGKVVPKKPAGIKPGDLFTASPDLGPKEAIEQIKEEIIQEALRLSSGNVKTIYPIVQLANQLKTFQSK